MLNTSTFYKIYNKLFMNDFLDVIVEGIDKKKINIINKKLNIFDVGSYKGTFSIDLQKKLKSKKRLNFYLFDPCKKFVDFDKTQLKFYKYYDYAMDSSKPSVKKFYLNNFLHASGSSLKGASFKDWKYHLSRTSIAFFLNPLKKMVKVIKVKTNNIDNFCKEKKIKHIDILKIDTEGTELDVLVGSKKMLNHIDIICSEIQCSKSQFEYRVKKIENLLNKNFEIYYKKRIFIASILTGIISYDYIFVKKSLLSK